MDVVSRLLLQDVSTTNIAEQVALRVLGKIGESICFGWKACYVGASIGAALYPLHGQKE